MAKINVNGITREMTQEEMQVYENAFPPPSYKERVVDRIRERYSINDEIAIIRQRDTKPLEFEEYNAFVEQIKAEEREPV